MKRLLILLLICLSLTGCIVYGPVKYVTYTQDGCAYIVEGMRLNGYESQPNGMQLWANGWPSIERSVEHDQSGCMTWARTKQMTELFRDNLTPDQKEQMLQLIMFKRDAQRFQIWEIANSRGEIPTQYRLKL